MDQQFHDQLLKAEISKLASGKPYSPDALIEGAFQRQKLLGYFGGAVLIVGALAIVWRTGVASWVVNQWEAHQATVAQQAVKDSVRKEQDKILSVRCVGPQLTSPACVEWARSR